MIVVMPDRDYQCWLLQTTPPASTVQAGFIGAEVARQPDDEDAPPRRPIGFRMPEPPAPAHELALPDWLLE